MYLLCFLDSASLERRRNYSTLTGSCLLIALQVDLRVCNSTFTYSVFNMAAQLIQMVTVVDKSGKAVNSVSYFIPSLLMSKILTTATEQTYCKRLEGGQSCLQRTKGRSSCRAEPWKSWSTFSEKSQDLYHPGGRLFPVFITQTFEFASPQ